MKERKRESERKAKKRVALPESARAFDAFRSRIPCSDLPNR